jgi:hypothetical protein
VPRELSPKGQVRARSNAAASWRARTPGQPGQAIERHFLLLESTPGIGRPFPHLPELRELLIGFGDSGYVTPYRHNPAADAI